MNVSIKNYRLRIGNWILPENGATDFLSLARHFANYCKTLKKKHDDGKVSCKANFYFLVESHYHLFYFYWLKFVSTILMLYSCTEINWQYLLNPPRFLYEWELSICRVKIVVECSKSARPKIGTMFSKHFENSELDVLSF
jgi:hypothetical protein